MTRLARRSAICCGEWEDGIEKAGTMGGTERGCERKKDEDAEKERSRKKRAGEGQRETGELYAAEVVSIPGCDLISFRNLASYTPIVRRISPPTLFHPPVSERWLCPSLYTLRYPCDNAPSQPPLLLRPSYSVWQCTGANVGFPDARNFSNGPSRYYRYSPVPPPPRPRFCWQIKMFGAAGYRSRDGDPRSR